MDVTIQKFERFVNRCSRLLTADVPATLILATDARMTQQLVAHEPDLAVQARSQRLAEFFATLLANVGGLALAPLAILSPLARNPRYRRRVQWLTAILLVLLAFGIGSALGSEGGLFVPARSKLAILNEQSAAAALQTGGTTTIDYTYDGLYRLTDAAYSTGQSFGYTYDAAGNRESTAVDGSTVMTYTYDIANRLTQVGDLDTSDLLDYAYDNNGNLLSDGVYTYTYDTANRLTQLNDGVSTMAYAYNGDGVRVAQIVDGLRTDYVQDIADPWSQLPQALTARQGGTTSKYLRGLGLIGEEIAGSGSQAAPAAWQYTLPDALGSVRQVVDANGVVTLGSSYDPFGGVMARDGAARSAYGFAGEEQDETTEQLYLRARTYNPGTGRFLQQDSVLGSGTDPRTLHRYAYAFNNPVNYTDPAGLMPAGSSDRVRSSFSSRFNEVRQEISDITQTFNNARSAKWRNWQTFSSETAKLASLGWRPFVCGFGYHLQDHLPSLVKTINPFYSMKAVANHILSRMEETGTLEQFNTLIKNTSHDVRQFMQQKGISTVLIEAKTRATLAYDWAATQWQSFNEWGADLVGGEERWETIKLGVAWAAVGAVSLLVPGAAVLFGVGTVLGGTVGVSKQLLNDGDFDGLEALRMTFRGGIAGGLTGIIGAGAGTSTIASALAGGYVNASVNYLLTPNEDAEEFFLADFAIGAVSSMAGEFITSQFGFGVLGKGMVSGILEASESYASSQLKVHFGKGYEQNKPSDYILAFGTGFGGSVAGDFLEKALPRVGRFIHGRLEGQYARRLNNFNRQFRPLAQQISKVRGTLQELRTLETHLRRNIEVFNTLKHFPENDFLVSAHQRFTQRLSAVGSQIRRFTGSLNEYGQQLKQLARNKPSPSSGLRLMRIAGRNIDDITQATSQIVGEADWYDPSNFGISGIQAWFDQRIHSGDESPFTRTPTKTYLPIIVKP